MISSMQYLNWSFRSFMNLFCFDISKSIIKIRLAMIYEPLILKNYISKRRYNCFLYVLDGEYEYEIKNGSKIDRLRVPMGNLLYIPAECRPYEYTIAHGANSPTKSMQIEFEIINGESGNPLSFSTVPVIINSQSPLIKDSIINVINLYSSVSFSERNMAYSEFIKLISLVSNEKTNDDKKPSSAIIPAIRYIEQNYTSKIHSDELAKLCSLSESQLRRCFKSVLGISPKSYQNELIFKSAKDLLSVGEFNISEISEMLGFYDVYAFSHFFAKKAGYSPREFIKRTRKVSDA